MAAERVLASIADRIMTLDKLIEDKSKQKRVTEDDTFAFVESKRNENTKKKTNSDVNRFKEWLCQDGQNSNNHSRG